MFTQQNLPHVLKQGSIETTQNSLPSANVRPSSLIRRNKEQPTHQQVNSPSLNVERSLLARRLDRTNLKMDHTDRPYSAFTSSTTQKTVKQGAAEHRRDLDPCSSLGFPQQVSATNPDRIRPCSQLLTRQRGTPKATGTHRVVVNLMEERLDVRTSQTTTRTTALGSGFYL